MIPRKIEENVARVMKRVYYVKDDENDLVVPYDRDLGLSFYEREVRKSVLPSSCKELLRHFSVFSEFLDDLSEAIIVQCIERPMSIIVEQPQPPVIIVEQQKEKRIRQWYEIEESSSEEESTVDLPENEMATHEPSIAPTASSIDIVSLCGVAWEWHNDVIERKKEAMTSFYAYSYMLSWVSFCRLFYMSITQDNHKYTRYNECILADHEYVHSMQDMACIVVTGAPLYEYTIREIWNTASELLSSLYDRQYTLSMREYVHIVLFRYTTFLSKYFDDENDAVLFDDDPSFAQYNEISIIDDHGDDEESDEYEGEDDSEDEDLITETYDEYKGLTIPVHPNYAIKSRFILEGELLFYSQLLRLNLSSRFQSLSLMPLAYNTRVSNYCEILTRCLDACCKMISSVTSSRILRYETGEGYKGTLASMHLYHGEKDRFSRLWPGSSNEPNDVISRFRPSDNLKISETRRMGVPLICSTYQSEFQSIILRMRESGIRAEDGGEMTTPYRLFPFFSVDYEREMVLLAHVCISEWFNYGALKIVHGVKNAFIIEEIRHLHEIDQIIVTHRERHHGKTSTNRPSIPYLVKLMQVYYVIDINQREIRSYATHFFVEAYILWQAMMCKYKLVPIKLVHEELRPMVTTLQEFLLL